MWHKCMQEELCSAASQSTEKNKDGLWHMDQALLFRQLLTSGLALLGHLGCCGIQVRLHVIYTGLQVRKV